MPIPTNDKAHGFSVKLYKRLLVVYPRKHRLEFGSSMTQHFRDQCRDAWNEGGRFGLAGLWPRVLMDLLKTSAAEHLQNLKRKIPMLEKFLRNFYANSTSRITFVAVTMVVFLLTVGGAALMAFLTPNSYRGCVRLLTKPGVNLLKLDLNRVRLAVSAEEFAEVVKGLTSESVLNPVITEMGLRRKWAATGSAAGELEMREAYERLRRQIEIRRGGPGMMEVIVLDPDKQAAADIANAIAESYARANREPSTSAERWQGVVIVDMAVPRAVPFRPNKPLMIFMGIVWGTPLGLILGGASALLATLLPRRSH